MDGYIGLFLETGNPTFYMMAKQNEAKNPPTHKGETSARG